MFRIVRSGARPTSARILRCNLSSSTNGSSSGNGKILRNITISLFAFDVAYGLIVYKYDKDPSFASYIQGMAPSTVIQTIEYGREQGRAFGILTKDSATVVEPLASSTTSLSSTTPDSSEGIAAIIESKNETSPKESIEEIKRKIIESRQKAKEAKKGSKKVIVPPEAPAVEAEAIAVEPPKEVVPVVESLSVEPILVESVPAQEPSPVPLEGVKPSVEETRILPSVPSEAIAKALEKDATVVLADKMAAESIALRKEFEATFLKDVDTLDLPTLRIRYIQLASDFFERNKWEGVKIQQAIKSAESEVSIRYLELLRNQRIELESQFESLLKKKEAELAETSSKKLDEVTKKLEEHHAALVVNLTATQDKKLEDELLKQQQVITAEADSRALHEIALAKQEQSKKLVQLQTSVEELHGKLGSFNQIASDAAILKITSSGLHKASASIAALELVLTTSEPSLAHAERVKSLSKQDDFVVAVIDAIPKEGLKVGIPTHTVLKIRFAVVRNEARKAALAPEGVPTLIGQVVGSGLASISWSPKGFVKGPGVEETLSRADYHLERGNLRDALTEVESITGFAGSLLTDWKTLAKQRLIADQAVKLLRADSILRHNTFS